MPSTIRPSIDFYSRNGISPVAQDVEVMLRHFYRRALYTASSFPERFVLVDGSPTGLQRARELLAPFQMAPARVAEHVASFAREGGPVAFTTIDAVSFLSEILRRPMAGWGRER